MGLFLDLVKPEKKYCKHCGERLQTERLILSYDEYTGEPVYAPERKICPNRYCHGKSAWMDR